MGRRLVILALRGDAAFAYSGRPPVCGIEPTTKRTIAKFLSLHQGCSRAGAAAIVVGGYTDNTSVGPQIAGFSNNLDPLCKRSQARELFAGAHRTALAASRTRGRVGGRPPVLNARQGPGSEGNAPSR